MTKRAFYPVAIAFAVALAVGCGAATAAPLAAQEADPGAVVWLVRHAERADDGMHDQPDPELSAAGQARARELARLLSEAGITSIHSTPYRRTQQTAQPLAEALGLTVNAYDPRAGQEMEAWLDALRRAGRHLVVGHSNTTPAMVEALGGDAGPPIDADEYDRIYVLHIAGSGRVTSTLLRFGASAPGG